MRRGYFQPATAERFTAGFDTDGGLLALIHQTTSSYLTIYDIHDGRNIWTAPPRAARDADAYEKEQSPWGAYDTPYTFPSLRVDCADVTSPVPVGPWRAVEYPSNLLHREWFLDAMARPQRQAAADRVTPRAPAARRKNGWSLQDRSRPPGARAGARDWRLLASRPPHWKFCRFAPAAHAAYVYQVRQLHRPVADVSIAEDGSNLRVHRLTTVVDCGIALNPLGVIGQTESGITWGLSAALLGKMDFKADAPVQGNLITRSCGSIDAGARHRPARQSPSCARRVRRYPVLRCIWPSPTRSSPRPVSGRSRCRLPRDPGDRRDKIVLSCRPALRRALLSCFARCATATTACSSAGRSCRSPARGSRQRRRAGWCTG